MSSWYSETIECYRLIVIHSIALVTSVYVRCVRFRCNADNSHNIPEKELIVAEQAAFTKVATEDRKMTRTVIILSWRIDSWI